MNFNNIIPIWKKTINQLKNKLTPKSYATWINTMKPFALKNNIFYIIVSDQFTKDWLNNHYAIMFGEIISEIVNIRTLAQFILEEETVQLIDNKNGLLDELENLKYSTLNPRYTFENYVVGNNNRFAHAACLAVADSPAKGYNPLFIYGGVGLGKTHLMHAIGHFARQSYGSSYIVAYVTTEQFTNNLIRAIREEKTVDFKNIYRNIDILLIDDIQFLAGKEATQEEFFYTFNTLYEANKQIVISSDRLPKAIPTLEDRLRSRFEWGLITDIQPPDYETRIAILQKKAQLENLSVSNDVITLIADRIQSNIRELEGALITVTAYSAINNEIVDRDKAAEVLKDILPDKKPVEITIDLIQQKVALFYNIHLDDMKSKKRSRNVAYPRQIAMYLCRELTTQSLPNIGDRFGGKDHTTVLHAHAKIARNLTVDNTLSEKIQELITNIKQN